MLVPRPPPPLNPAAPARPPASPTTTTAMLWLASRGGPACPPACASPWRRRRRQRFRRSLRCHQHPRRAPFGTTSSSRRAGDDLVVDTRGCGARRPTLLLPLPSMGRRGARTHCSANRRRQSGRRWSAGQHGRRRHVVGVSALGQPAGQLRPGPRPHGEQAQAGACASSRGLRVDGSGRDVIDGGRSARSSSPRRRSPSFSFDLLPISLATSGSRSGRCARSPCPGPAAHPRR